jgi:hypothetical protein
MIRFSKLTRTVARLKVRPTPACRRLYATSSCHGGEETMAHSFVFPCVALQRPVRCLEFSTPDILTEASAWLPFGRHDESC